MKGIAFVPARGGSKRLKNKNIVELAGKPLIHYTLDALSECFDSIVVASDSDEIKKVASEHVSDPQIESLPLTTTTDTSTVLESMVDLVCKKDLANSYDFIGQFLVTCPFRCVSDVEAAIGLMEACGRDIDGVVSITTYDFPPELGLCVDPDHNLHCFDRSLPWLTGRTRSQDYNSVFRPNGAIYLRWTDSFKKDQNFYKGVVKSLMMPKGRSLDVDTLDDLKLAEVMLNG
jgi:CMP-N-acetylneuraminic acid synthetase